MSLLLYSGTSIKPTPLGNSLLAVIERWSGLHWEVSRANHSMLYESILATNESWSFANCFSSSYKLWKGCRDTLQLNYHDCFSYLSSNFLLILGVAVCSGRLFSIAKADWATRKLLVVRSREVAVPERLLYIEVIVVSIRTWVLGRFIACGCSLEVVVNGGSTVLVSHIFTHVQTFISLQGKAWSRNGLNR